jgi:hypothetical protein
VSGPSKKSRSTLATLAALAALAFAGCGVSFGDASDEVVAPKGAHYSYPVPKGFESSNPIFPGRGPKFLTTVVPEGSSKEGYLGIYEVPLRASERRLPSQRLLAQFDAKTQAFYSGEGATLSAGIATQIAGHDAICWKIHSFENSFEGIVEADSCAIAANHNLLVQSCTWKPRTAAVANRGCEEMRATLRLS